MKLERMNNQLAKRKLERKRASCYLFSTFCSPSRVCHQQLFVPVDLVVRCLRHGDHPQMEASQRSRARQLGDRRIGLQRRGVHLAASAVSPGVVQSGRFGLVDCAALIGHRVHKQLDPGQPNMEAAVCRVHSGKARGERENNGTREKEI